MTQLTSSNFPIDPVTTSGDALAEILNTFSKATHSTNLGTGRPPQNITGGLWVDSATAGKLKLMMSTGTSTDKELLSIDLTTSAVSVAGSSGSSAAARTFVSGTTYAKGNIVFHDGNYYRADVASPGGTPGGSTDWIHLSTGLADAITATLKADYVAKAGDTMTGNLTIEANLTVAGIIRCAGEIAAFATI
jgi:hypothetical protein